MNNKPKAAISRLEAMVSELECEFLYLLNDVSVMAADEPDKMRTLVSNLNLARHFLGAAAAEARRESAHAAAN